MPTYYEILDISPVSRGTEIEAALDKQYNQVRRLITHHDPAIVNRANEELQLLERIRSVLMDPGKRMAYDAAIQSLTGGLTDLRSVAALPDSSSLFSASMPAAASQPVASPAPVLTAQRSWVCPKCQSVNPLNSQFCKRCGGVLAAPCPYCGVLVERQADFCSSCGANIEKAQQKRDLEKQLDEARSALTTTANHPPSPDPAIPWLNVFAVGGAGWAMTAWIAALAFLTVKPGNLPGVDLSSLLDAARFSPLSVQAIISNLAPAVPALVLSLGAIFSISILRRTSPMHGLGAFLAAGFLVFLPPTLFSVLFHMTRDNIWAGMIAALLIYMSVFGTLKRRTREFFKLLKPATPRLPSVGFFGTLFFWILNAIVLIYGLYAAGLIIPSLKDIGLTAQRYQSQAYLANGLQLALLGALLAAYTLLSVRQAQTREIFFRRAAFEHSETKEKLTRQIQMLERAVVQIDIHSQ